MIIPQHGPIDTAPSPYWRNHFNPPAAPAAQEITVGLFHFHGMPIITSPALPFIRAKRVMVTKPWHCRRGAGNYAERVRKKWLKRFGTEEVNMLLSNGRYFVSAAVASQLMNASLR